MSTGTFPDVMVDIETTGLDQSNCMIMQISAVKFNLRETTICPDMFDRWLLPAPKRFWQESCRQWWGKRDPSILEEGLKRMEPPQQVLQALRDWSGPDLTMWAMPIHFDHSFLDSYFQQFDMQIPFFYRQANDMNSFIRGRCWPNEPKNWFSEVEFTGKAHNAIDDVLHQIKVLMTAVYETGPGV